MIVTATFIAESDLPEGYEKGKEYTLMIADGEAQTDGLIEAAQAITGEEKRVYKGITDFFKYWGNVSPKG